MTRAARFYCLGTLTGRMKRSQSGRRASTIEGKITLEHRFYISSVPANAARLNGSIRQHWRVENSVHWCMDVVFGDMERRCTYLKNWAVGRRTGWCSGMPI